MLVAGRERQYLEAFFNARVFNLAGVDSRSFNTYVAAYEAPGAMRAGFELYRAFDRDVEDNRAALNRNGRSPLNYRPHACQGTPRGFGPIRYAMYSLVIQQRSFGRIRLDSVWQITLPPPGDIDPNVAAGAPATFEAIVGTDQGQVAVAPGELRRTWSEPGRRYSHYVSDAPISGTHAFFSGDYAVHRERWKDVDIQVFVHPGHTEHMGRLLRGVRASLDYFSAQFGPYPYRFLQIVEQPGNFFGMGVDGSGVVTGGEGFFLLDPQGDGFDVIFEPTASLT